MKKIIILFVLLTTAFAVHAQVAINKDGSSPTSGSILDVKGSGNHYFFIDDATGKVGINTTSPSEMLEVEGNAYVKGFVKVPYTGAFLVGGYKGLSWSATTGSVVLGGDLSDVELRAHNNVLMFLDYTKANIGINTTSPNSNSILDVQGGSKWIQFQTDDGYGVRVLESDGGNNAIILNGYGTRGNIKMFDQGVQTVNFDAQGSLPSYIKTQTFGIGTSSPNYPLHVHGTGAYSYAQFTTSTTGTAAADGLHIGVNNNDDALFQIAGANDMHFKANGNEYLTIKSDGKVGVGTTSPSEKLEVDGNANIIGDLNVDGDFEAAGYVYANGDVWGTDGYFSNNVEAENVNAGTDITAGGDISADGDLLGTNAYITNDAEVGDQLLVGGASTGARQMAIKGASGRVGLAIEADGSGYAALWIANSSGNAIQVNNGDISVYNNNNINLNGTNSNLKLNGDYSDVDLEGDHSDVNLNGTNSNINLNGTNSDVNLDGDDSDVNLNGIASSLKINGTGEVNRAAQGTADLVPIAYGVVNYDGTALNAGTGNWSVSWNSAYKQYEISITGETYYYINYITQATLLSGGAITIQTGSVSGDLIVHTKDSSGNGIQNTFSFVVYKP